MTREIIRQIERDYWTEKADPIDMSEIFDLAQKALEQESIIDKIKENIQFIKDKCLPNTIAEEYEQKGLQEALDIIDKYKGESKDKE